MWSDYSVLGFTSMLAQAWMMSPSYEAKELWIANDSTPPQHSACEKAKDKNIAGLPLSILQPQSSLVHCIIFASNKD